MLIVTIHNDGTGTPEQGNYDVEVLITVSTTRMVALAKGRIEQHNRREGWRPLLQRVIEELPDSDPLLDALMILEEERRNETPPPVGSA